MKDDGILAHHRLKAATERFACRYADLDERARRTVDAAAKRAQAMEDAVLASGEAESVNVPPTNINHALKEVRARYQSEAEFEADLAANGLSPESLKAALLRELKAEAVLDKIADGALPPTNAELLAWYDAHPDRFAAPETRDARHILITVNEDFAENRPATALERITAIGRRLDGTPETFADIAQRHSECPTAMEGGRIGTVSRGTLYPELDTALFWLGEGQVSGVLKSEIGFHIVLCEAIHPARHVAFAEAREKIRTAMNDKRRQTAKAHWLAALMAARLPETV